MKHLFIVFVLLFITADVWAQPQAPPPPGARANRLRGAGLTPADVEDMFDALTLVQAEKALQVAEPQYAEFVTRLKNLQQTRKRNRHARNQILRELQRLTAPRESADEAVIRERLKALKDHDDRAAAELGKAYDALDHVLDARQQARFRVFELSMERQKLDMLVRARQGAARGRS
jgi:hypothetical protein